MTARDLQTADLSSSRELTIHGLGASSPGYWDKVCELRLERIRQHQNDFHAWASAAERGKHVPELIDGECARVVFPWRSGLDAHYLLYGARNLLRYADV